MLNPHWLRTFAILAEEGSFTRTGARLDLTQAAVSQHLRQLEDELGPLLIRRPRKIELTPAGAALLDYCRDADHAERRLRQRLRQDEDGGGEISLITPGSIGLCLYPWLLELQSANPELVVRHRFAPDAEVLTAVLDNRYELGLVTLRPDDSRLTAQRFAEEPLELVLPAERDLHDWDDLVALGFIDHPDGQAMATRLLSRSFPDAPGMRHMPCSGFSNQIGLILEPVARGLGFTVIPRFARQAFARQEALRVIQCDTGIVDTLWLIHRAEWPLSARAQRAIDYLSQRMGKQ
ncbi:LysR family transcriptional regulator [Duganella sp. FT80W]|uniref:LysR family transcriptional regulator n=1 Tax=Duganella guangzhouensis TaxID=2666084 RepID=A0A6I2L8C5_9BURK|nr:LysR family transcriptional regulator [Duganella guangzhouensis]MRW93457.1 LysR family transcriptional regulator [Duganella guangzhouensis]